MNCDDLLRAINAEIDADLELDIDPAICEHLRQHLDNCEPCRVVVNTLDQTVQLYRAHQEVASVSLTPYLRQRIDDAVRQRWQEVFGSSSAD